MSRGLVEIDDRYRDKAEEILQRRKREVLVGALRRSYGESFASGLEPNEPLRDVLTRLDKRSLSQLIHDYEAGTLYNILTFSRYLSRLG